MTLIRRFVSAVLLAMAGIGISAAADVAPMYGVPVLPPYGVVPPPQSAPKTEVTIHGTVTTEDGKQTVKDIKISVADTRITTSTDENGAYSLTVGMNEGQTVQLVVVDIDGQANGGLFASEVADVTLNTKNEDPKDDTDQTVNISLKKKEAK